MCDPNTVYKVQCKVTQMSYEKTEEHNVHESKNNATPLTETQNS